MAVVAGILLGAQSCDDNEDNNPSAPLPPTAVDGIWEGSFERPVNTSPDAPRIQAGAVLPVANAGVGFGADGRDISVAIEYQC